MRIASVVEVTFCAGHRLEDEAFGDCRSIHGHNWTVRVELSYDEGAELIDFGYIKRELRGWINEHWDHAFIYHRDDGTAKAALEAFNLCAPPGGYKCRAFEMERPPTCENMALLILQDVLPDIFPEFHDPNSMVRFDRVAISESNASWGAVSL